jgi:putative transposase
MSLFKNKYRIESARLPGWNYSWPGFYFVTVCTRDHTCLFGEISDGNMLLNDNGKIVHAEWRHSFEIRRELIPDEFIVMPNHVHGIVRIADYRVNADKSVETPCHGVSTMKTATMKTAKPTTMKNTTALCKQFHWKSGVLGAFIGQFKQQVTKKIRETGFPGFQWQPRFHDHIVRNEHELFRIRHYIKNNPANWQKDKFNRSDSGNSICEGNVEYGYEPWMI